MTNASGKAGDFDFLSGEWKIAHRRLNNAVWDLFDGEATVVAILGGITSMAISALPCRRTISAHGPEGGISATSSPIAISAASISSRLKGPVDSKRISVPSKASADCPCTGKGPTLYWSVERRAIVVIAKAHFPGARALNTARLIACTAVLIDGSGTGA